MEESATYQAIVRKGREQGRAEEARDILLLMGEADSATQSAINAISDLEQLHELAARLANATGWQELMLRPPGRNGRRRANR